MTGTFCYKCLDRDSRTSHSCISGGDRISSVLRRRRRPIRYRSMHPIRKCPRFDDLLSILCELWRSKLKVEQISQVFLAFAMNAGHRFLSVGVFCRRWLVWPSGWGSIQMRPCFRLLCTAGIWNIQTGNVIMSYQDYKTKYMSQYVWFNKIYFENILRTNKNNICLII